MPFDQRAPKISARFVMLFDPGTRMVASGGLLSGMISKASGYERSVIIYAHEKQAAGRRCGTSLTAIFGMQNLRDLVFRPVASADIHERAGNRSHHIVQETVGLHVEPNPVSQAIHRQVGDGPDAGQAVGPNRFENPEIMSAAQTPGPTAHSLGIPRVSALVAKAA